MRYRRLGKTGLDVSILGFGASSLGGVFGQIDPADAERAVHVSLDAGINFIDVSPYYGLTRAETVLGEALRGINRQRYLLATKVGRYGAAMADFDFSPARVVASVDESLRRLGVDHIDLIQCHDIEFGSLDQIVEETLPALRRVRDAGKVRFIGITGLPLAVFPAVLERTEVDTVLSYCHYTLNDTALADHLEYLDDKGVGIISAAPLGMGLLSTRTVPDWHPAPPAVTDACARAAAHCQRRGVPIEKLALQFAVAEERIATTVVGTARSQDMLNNIAWVEEDIDQDVLAEVLEILQPIHNITWPSGRPENNG